MVERGMNLDYSWKKSTECYVGLYRYLLGEV